MSGDTDYLNWKKEQDADPSNRLVGYVKSRTCKDCGVTTIKYKRCKSCHYKFKGWNVDN